MMISIIIPVYNAALYIQQCVESVLKQTYSVLEIILVDDGSTDESGKICDELALSDSRIVVVHKENGGAASARNIGLNLAKGDFIAFIDADDYIESNMCKEMLAEMSDSRVSIVCCGIRVVDVSGRENVFISDKKLHYSKEEALYDFFMRKDNIKPSACNKVYRKSVFSEKNLRFSESSFHEDTEIMPFLLDAAENVVILDKAFYNYVKRENSKTTNKHFNLKGYHLLKELKKCEVMCKEKNPQSIKWFKWYELVTVYEMLLYLRSCVDYKHYIQYELSMRWQVLKNICKCMKWKVFRTEYANAVREMLIKSVLGVKLSDFIFSHPKRRKEY